MTTIEWARKLSEQDIKVLRGQATPTGSHVSKLVDGYVAALDQRLPYDPAAASRLLAEAGFENGFAVTLDCVNVAFRAAVCQAIAGMLARVGVRVSFQPWPTSQFFPKLTQATSSFFEFGWSPGNDAWAIFNATVHSFGDGGYGAFNGGRYSNPKLDSLSDALRASDAVIDESSPPVRYAPTGTSARKRIPTLRSMISSSCSITSTGSSVASG
jgi:ABC-type transport system substrate-binding protein